MQYHITWQTAIDNAIFYEKKTHEFNDVLAIMIFWSDEDNAKCILIA